MRNEINILHISDLHLTTLSHDQDAVLSSLYKCVQSIIAQGEQIDLIAFSGDLTSKGAYSVETKKKIHDFLSDVTNSAKIEPSQVVICPGNHDADISKLTSFSKRGLEAIGTRIDANLFIDEMVAEALRPFDEFKDTLTTFFGASPYNNHPTYYTKTFQWNKQLVGVAVLNSAWRCRGLAENKDYGHLLIGERQIELALAELNACALKIAVMHHPVNWLAPFEQAYVHRALAANFQLVLCGHNHSSDALNVANGHTVFLTSNAGCLYHTRDYFNGFSLIKANISTSAIDIHAFEYFNERSVFAPTERFGQNGTRSFSLSADTMILEFAKPELIEDVRSRVNRQLLSFTASNVAPKDLESVFVEPQLSTKSELVPGEMGNKTADDNSKARNFRLADLLLEESKIVLLGRKESGKTTLANFVATNFRTFRLPKVIAACVIDCSKLQRLTQARIFELATQFFASHVTIRDIKKLASQGQMLFCFDGISFDEKALVQLLVEFAGEYSQNRFLFTSVDSTNQTVSSRPLSGESNSIASSLGKPIYIQSFRRKQTRELVQKWFGITEGMLEDRIDQVSQFLKKLGVPRTPFLVSLVLWVIENQPKTDLVNQAAALEAMVDGLLGKLTESKDRSRLDARLKTLFLMDLAYSLYSQNERRLDRVQVEKFIAEYFSAKGWKESAFELLEELLDKGFLIELDGQVEFKFDCFRAFFLGQKLNEDSNFFTQSLSRNVFSKLHTEIDFATGLARNRKDYLDNIFFFVKRFGTRLNLRLMWLR